jgi:hypothetical protein
LIVADFGSQICPARPPQLSGRRPQWGSLDRRTSGATNARGAFRLRGKSRPVRGKRIRRGTRAIRRTLQTSGRKLAARMSKRLGPAEVPEKIDHPQCRGPPLRVGFLMRVGFLKRHLGESTMTEPARQEDSGHHDGHQFPASFLGCSPPARGVCQHSCLACERSVGPAMMP